MEFQDFQEISNLINRYPQCADRGDFDGVGELYAEANLYAPGEDKPMFQAEGARKFTEAYKRMVRVYPDSGTPKTRHLIGNVIIEDDGPERAKAQSYVVVFQQTPQLPLQPVIAGTYYDRFAKVDGRWRLVERREDMELVGDLSQHLTIKFPPDEEELKRALEG